MFKNKNMNLKDYISSRTKSVLLSILGNIISFIVKAKSQEFRLIIYKVGSS